MSRLMWFVPPFAQIRDESIYRCTTCGRDVDEGDPLWIDKEGYVYCELHRSKLGGDKRSEKD